MNKHRTTSGITAYAIAAITIFILHYLLDLDFPQAWDKYIPLLKKLTLSLLLISIILLISKVIERLIDTQTKVEGDRYNLLRIVRLLSIIFIGIVVASFLFQNLYAAAVSFGVISLVLGFALQSPITSFIAWLYIVFRRPYQVGHRIQLNDLVGDVIEINYLDTVILECSGIYLGNDRRSGRIVHFPNSLILKEEVVNYAGPDAPFIWNETPLQVAYSSDLKFVEECLLQAAQADFKQRYPDMSEMKRWEHMVYFRVNAYAWMEAVILYPVEPTDTTARRNRILRAALPLLNAAPDKVQFPEGSAR